MRQKVIEGSQLVVNQGSTGPSRTSALEERFD
ncbi:uncharacterized protein METZ01_LOCUS202692 [marine metagenome]|uniref:Uncharacterized protein n=1 Tax=marine metagenome TaxID=408172 RepID=A0A382EGI0_9ZZZZ